MTPWTFVLKDSQERVKRLQEQLKAAEADEPRYVIAIMPDTQVTYGAKPDALQALANLGIPVPKLPEGFGFAMEASQLTATFTAEEATVKVAELVPQHSNRLLAVVRLSKWLESRLSEQRSIINMSTTVIANQAIASHGSRTVH